MDAAKRFDRTNRFDRTVDLTSSRSRHAEIPEESSSVSDGPDPSADDSPTSDSVSLDSCPGDSSDSDGPELRHDDSPDGHGYFTRDDFLGYYGDIDGAARWERARVHDSADNADGWNIGADTHSIPANPRDSYEGSDNDVDNAGGSCGPRRPPVGPGIPRACHACGETFPSGNVLFRDHLTDARVCPYAPGSPPGSSGIPSGGSGGASADAGERGGAASNDSDAAMP